MLIIKSIKTKNLNFKQKKNIYLLKNEEWKFSQKSQKIWFKKNIKSNDLHNMLILNKKLIGYNCLRYKLNKNKKYLLFDTFIIKKSFRKRKFSKLLMKFNIQLFKILNLEVYLICRKILLNYYKKNNWFIVKPSNVIKGNKFITSKLNKKFFLMKAKY